jgi:copper chaperone CopZ
MRKWVPFFLLLFAWQGEAPAEGLAVSVQGLHLCCGGCEAALKKALGQEAGVEQLTIDREQGTLQFRVGSDPQVDSALTKMVMAGFFGEAQVDGAERAIELPTIEADATAQRVEFVGVHLCCKRCVRDVVAAFEDANEVESVDCDLKTGRVVLTGEKIHVLDARRRLHQAGFHGRWKPDEPAAP